MHADASGEPVFCLDRDKDVGDGEMLYQPKLMLSRVAFVSELIPLGLFRSSEV